MFIDSRCHVMLFFLLTLANRLGLTSQWPAWPLTLFLCYVCAGSTRLRRRSVWECIFLQYIIIMLLTQVKSLSVLTFPLQQVQTSVWDVSSPFKIILVNGSKVNAEETVKVNTSLKHSFRFLLICLYKHSHAMSSSWVMQRCHESHCELHMRLLVTFYLFFFTHNVPN